MPHSPETARTIPPLPTDWLQAAANSIAASLAARLQPAAPSSVAPKVTPYLSVTEAADLLRCRPQRVYDLLSRRRLSRIKDGSRVLVSRRELEDYLTRGSTIAD